MPVGRYGQLITLAIELDEDQRFRRWVWVNVHVGDTVQKIVARSGHPQDARRVARMNHIRSVRAVLRHRHHRKTDRKRIKAPGRFKSGTLNLLAGDSAPHVTGGYAKFETIDRPERTGLTQFDGYDPITMDVPIRFEGVWSDNGARIERECALLEKMAGRGPFAGSGLGPPPVVRISTTGPNGEIRPLVPRNFQWSGKVRGLLWVVTNVDWDDNPLRSRYGNRIRQLATVTLQQRTHISLAEHSVAQRHQHHAHKARRKH